MKVIAAINMTIDGYCDHTYGIADEALHRHYEELLQTADILLYGRITYQLMEFWPSLVKEPSGNKAMDDFAIIMDKTPKLVFSRTLKKLDWESARLATKNLQQELSTLQQQGYNHVFVGSPGLIAQLTRLQLIDEYQLCIHPVLAGEGLPLFKNIGELQQLHFERSKTLASGAIVHYYQTIK